MATATVKIPMGNMAETASGSCPLCGAAGGASAGMMGCAHFGHWYAMLLTLAEHPGQEMRATGYAPSEAGRLAGISITTIRPGRRKKSVIRNPARGRPFVYA
jgi:hypothetical protein